MAVKGQARWQSTGHNRIHERRRSATQEDVVRIGRPHRSIRQGLRHHIQDRARGTDRVGLRTRAAVLINGPDGECVNIRHRDCPGQQTTGAEPETGWQGAAGNRVSICAIPARRRELLADWHTGLEGSKRAGGNRNRHARRAVGWKAGIKETPAGERDIRHSTGRAINMELGHHVRTGRIRGRREGQDHIAEVTRAEHRIIACAVCRNAEVGYISGQRHICDQQGGGPRIAHNQRLHNRGDGVGQGSKVKIRRAE